MDKGDLHRRQCSADASRRRDISVQFVAIESRFVSRFAKSTAIDRFSDWSNGSYDESRSHPFRCSVVSAFFCRRRSSIRCPCPYAPNIDRKNRGVARPLAAMHMQGE
jgi:hypothetical protein